MEIRLIEYRPGDACDVIVGPLGKYARNDLVKAGIALKKAGLDVREDMRWLNFKARLATWHEDASMALVGNDSGVPNGIASAFGLGGIQGVNDIPIREAMAEILAELKPGAEMPEVKFDSDPKPIQVDAAPEAPPKDEPVSPFSVLKDMAADESKPLHLAEAEEEESDNDQSAIQSWDIEDQEGWMGAMGERIRVSARLALLEWKFAKRRQFPVRVGTRVYATLADAALDHGWTSPTGETTKFANAIRKGKTEYHGMSIGFADPALEAIRLGFTREQYENGDATGKVEDLFQNDPVPAPLPEQPQVESAVESWDIADEDGWREAMSKSTFASEAMAKRDWKMANRRCFPVRVNDRVYMQMKHAGFDHGWVSGGRITPDYPKAMKRGAVEFRGESIGFADPVLEAIRVGKTREQFEREWGGKVEAAVPRAAPEVDASAIKSWPLGDDGWRDRLSNASVGMAERVAASGEFPLYRQFAVRVGDRVYLTAKDACFAHGWVDANGQATRKFAEGLREGRTEHKGLAVGYADPRLEALRLANAPGGPKPARIPKRPPVTDIPTWELDDDSWKRTLTAGQREECDRMKAAWRLNDRPTAYTFIRVGDLIYRGPEDAARAHGWGGQAGAKLGNRLKKGVVQYNGVAVGYADPELEAIRVGKTREEFERESGNAPEKKKITIPDGIPTEAELGASVISASLFATKLLDEGKVAKAPPVKVAARPERKSGFDNLDREAQLEWIEQLRKRVKRKTPIVTRLRRRLAAWIAPGDSTDG